MQKKDDKYWENYAKRPFLKVKKEDRIYGCGIYIIKWDNCPYFYIGKSKDMNARMNRHLTSFRNEDCDSTKLLLVYLKYGLPKFNVLKYCSFLELSKYEREFLDLNRDNKYILNSQFSYNPKETFLEPFYAPVLTNGVVCCVCEDTSFKRFYNADIKDLKRIG